MSLRRFITLACAVLSAAGLSAQVVVSNYTETGNLPANDDQYSDAVSLGFTINFGGTSYSETYVSNNGYITFGAGSGNYSPAPLDNLYAASGAPGLPIIAPFYSDIDTRWPDSGIVSWGTGLIGGRLAFIARWDNVGEYGAPVFSPNTFSVVLVSRSDLGAGNFDVFFNYQTITWDRQGHVVAGFHSGGGENPIYYSLPGSLTSVDGENVVQTGVFFDGGLLSLAASTNTGTHGALSFSARDGNFLDIGPITVIPEPSTYVLLALGLGLIGFAARRRRRS
jgi:hypothetical protein